MTKPPISSWTLEIRRAASGETRKTSASTKTAPVCVSVVITPSARACQTVPCSPTRYAATSDLPCPGVRAWTAPKPAASKSSTARPRRVSSSKCRRFRGGPFSSLEGATTSGCAASLSSPLGSAALVRTKVADTLRSRSESPGLSSRRERSSRGLSGAITFCKLTPGSAVRVSSQAIEVFLIVVGLAKRERMRLPGCRRPSGREREVAA